MQHLHVLFFGRAVFVDADHRLLSGVDAGLRAGGGFFDSHLGNAGLNRLGHATQFFHFQDVTPRSLSQIVRQTLDIVTSAPWINNVAAIGFLLNEKLRVAGDASREIGRQGERLVERVGMQRLRVAVGGGQRLDAGPHDIVVDVLGGQAPAAGLAVRSQRQALGVLGIELLDQLGPQHAGRPQLGDFHEVVHADRPEERQPRRKRRRRRGRPATPARTYSTPSASV